MNENEFDLAARAWLEDGPTRMSDHAVQSALEEIHATRQRGTEWPAWRAAPVRLFARLAVAAVLVVAVGVLAGNVVRRQADGPTVGGPTPIPSPAADPTPGPSGSPSASPSPAQALGVAELTTTFVSPRNGFSMKHADTAVVTPATRPWEFGSNDRNDSFDIVDTGASGVFAGSTARIPDDLSTGPWASMDDWIDEQVADDSVCGVPRSEQAEITIDGQSGRIAECPSGIDATVVEGDHIYRFTLRDDGNDARTVFDALASTIDLTPQTAVDYPSLTSTFVSPVYGFALGYLDRGDGSRKPAKEPWNPASEPPVGAGTLRAPLDDGFDVFETGYGAVFKAASAEIPDGVSIDDWIDASLASRASTTTCMLPRSRQGEIIIDGQPAKISEGCAKQFIATLVVDGRLYVFMLGHSWNDEADARAFFDSWVRTIRLHPQDAGRTSVTPSP